jgi:hypothetical protein
MPLYFLSNAVKNISYPNTDEVERVAYHGCHQRENTVFITINTNSTVSKYMAL